MRSSETQSPFPCSHDSSVRNFKTSCNGYQSTISEWQHPVPVGTGPRGSTSVQYAECQGCMYLRPWLLLLLETSLPIRGQAQRLVESRTLMTAAHFPIVTSLIDKTHHYRSKGRIPSQASRLATVTHRCVDISKIYPVPMWLSPRTRCLLDSFALTSESLRGKTFLRQSLG